MYALLALNLPKQTSPLSGGGGSHSSKSTPRIIAGSVVGGVAFLALIAFGFLFYRRRHMRRGVALDRDTNAPGNFATMLFRFKRESSLALRQPSNRHQAEPYSYQRRTSSETSSVPHVEARLLPRKVLRSNTNYNIGSSVVAAKPTDSQSVDRTVELRREMEDLRREMEEIRMRGQYEPPPVYQ
ncbi:hypothetical protein GYMLUDRAFT_55766 [Collybiopsis luxurians FD-317 M1]|nr:hypothetical protein GYMLUDRAFT_55766 [Collybiopsis luxurians FD-317 M1]